MKFATILGALGLAQVYLAFQSPPSSYVWFWSAGSFLYAALAYAAIGPRAFSKRGDGTMYWWAVLGLLPYLALTWLVWHLERAVSREAVCNEVAPGRWIGRRPFREELPHGVGLIIDLTAEFPEARSVRMAAAYKCLPTLDASVPEARAFRDLVDLAAGWDGPVYVHCAQGHGRSAMFVIAVLISKGLADDIGEAEQIVAKARPGIGLSHVQRGLLELEMAERTKVPPAGQGAQDHRLH